MDGRGDTSAGATGSKDTQEAEKREGDQSDLPPMLTKEKPSLGSDNRARHELGEEGECDHGPDKIDDNIEERHRTCERFQQPETKRHDPKCCDGAIQAESDRLCSDLTLGRSSFEERQSRDGADATYRPCFRDLNHRRPPPRLTDVPPRPDVERETLIRFDPMLPLRPLLLAPIRSGPIVTDLRNPNPMPMPLSCLPLSCLARDAVAVSIERRPVPRIASVERRRPGVLGSRAVCVVSGR